MDVVVILAGVFCGLASGSPYLVALRYMRRTRKVDVLPGLVAVGASFLVIALSLLLAWVLARPSLVPFVLALLVAFLVTVVVGVVLFNRKPRS